MEKIKEYLKYFLLTLLCLVEGIISGFISIIIATGIYLFMFTDSRKIYKYAFAIGAFIGGILFILVLASAGLAFL